MNSSEIKLVNATIAILDVTRQDMEDSMMGGVRLKSNREAYIQIPGKIF
jgi:hypothetical protein